MHQFPTRDSEEKAEKVYQNNYKIPFCNYNRRCLPNRGCIVWLLDSFAQVLSRVPTVTQDPRLDRRFNRDSAGPGQLVF